MVSNLLLNFSKLFCGLTASSDLSEGGGAAKLGACGSVRNESRVRGLCVSDGLCSSEPPVGLRPRRDSGEVSRKDRAVTEESGDLSC